jgi:hypothetical protein
MSDNAILAAMRRLGIGKEEMTGHGFRAVARTILDEVLGVRTDFIEHQLAHAVRDPNGRAYNRTAHLAERRAMMQQWSGLSRRVEGRPCECSLTSLLVSHPDCTRGPTLAPGVPFRYPLSPLSENSPHRLHRWNCLCFASNRTGGT